MKLSLSDQRGEGDQDVIRAVRSAASAALWTDSSRGGGEQRAEREKYMFHWAGVELEQ